jgi:hypothetical protein
MAAEAGASAAILGSTNKPQTISPYKGLIAPQLRIATPIFAHALRTAPQRCTI